MILIRFWLIDKKLIKINNMIKQIKLQKIVQKMNNNNNNKFMMLIKLKKIENKSKNINKMIALIK